MNILLVEDDEAVVRFLQKGFRENGWEVEALRDGRQALEAAAGMSYDVIVLDLLLPGLHGLDILKAIRGQEIQTPVIILTALDDKEDVVRGLDLGADDYLVKPFSFNELIARIRAVLRRGENRTNSLLQVGDLVLDPIRHRVSRGKRRIELTQKEFALLEYLMRNKGRILTRSMILDHVWGYQFDTMTNLVDVHVYKLRNKVDKGFQPQLIKTVKGVGYVIEE